MWLPVLTIFTDKMAVTGIRQFKYFAMIMHHHHPNSQEIHITLPALCVPHFCSSLYYASTGQVFPIWTQCSPPLIKIAHLLGNIALRQHVEKWLDMNMKSTEMMEYYALLMTHHCIELHGGQHKVKNEILRIIFMRFTSFSETFYFYSSAYNVLLEIRNIVIPLDNSIIIN
mmetsp:Transcript_17547/g.26169  ORF Transcript_17547/g.26169 Transcript_17547/m.26169 type:complete len:171 (+) Transcript_17547:198-710(+)